MSKMQERAIELIAERAHWPIHPLDFRHRTEGLRSWGDRSVDHVITDPPYLPQVHAKGRRGVGRGEVVAKRELSFAPLTSELRWEAAQEFARVTRRWVIVFSCHEGSVLWKEALESAGLEYVRPMIWLKKGSTPQFSGDRPAMGHEVIVVAHQTKRAPGDPAKRWNGGGKHGVYGRQIVVEREEGQRLHDTQKPLDLMEDLIRDFTDPGEIIADPFAGSGTTIVAAKLLGRRAVGWEKDVAHAATAAARIAAAGRHLNP